MTVLWLCKGRRGLPLRAVLRSPSQVSNSPRIHLTAYGSGGLTAHMKLGVMPTAKKILVTHRMSLGMHL
jgi:hypothetical protein